MRDLIDCFCDWLRKNSARRFDKSPHRVGGAFADAHSRLRAIGMKIDPAHARLSCKRHKRRLQLVHLPRTQPESVFREDNNRPALWRLISQRAQLRGGCEIIWRNAWRGMKSDGHAIAKRDRAGLVEEQNVDVSRGFNCAPAHCENIALKHAI